MVSKNIFFTLFLIGCICLWSCNQKVAALQQAQASKAPVQYKTGPMIAIGQSYCGGIIFYVDSTKNHGLIAPARQELYAKWGCIHAGINGTSTSIGSGNANTIAILKTCTESNCAARLCSELVLNGYDDWFLPSKGELDLLYANKRFFRPFKTNYYWSSSEVNDSSSFCVDFYDGHKMTYEKNNSFYVHAIRAF